MENWGRMLGFLLEHQKILGYSAVSLLTAGSERIFAVVVFQCPCNDSNARYGAVFLLVPAFILFLLGWLLSVRSWKVLTGCCFPGKPCGCRHGNRLRRYLQVLGLVTVGAAVAPLTWISVALLGGSFYECAATGVPTLLNYSSACEGKREECYKVPCGPSDSSDIQILRSQSQVFGWILIASIFTVALLFTCFTRCRSPVSVLQLTFWKIYLEQEQQLFEVKAKEHARSLAERNLKCFFDSTKLEPFQTPSTKAWQNISSLFAFNPKDNYYSMIHKYVSQESPRGSILSAEGDTYPTCLQFVDTAGPNIITK